MTGGTGALGSSVALDLLNSESRTLITYRDDASALRYIVVPGWVCGRTLPVLAN